MTKRGREQGEVREEEREEAVEGRRGRDKRGKRADEEEEDKRGKRGEEKAYPSLSSFRPLLLAPCSSTTRRRLWSSSL